MIPKSTAKLIEGDFCWILREDGRFVPFIFIQSQNKSRSYFFGGLANQIVKEKSTEELSDSIQINEYALLHIHCFKENNTPIEGNLKNKIKSGTIATIKSDINKNSIGSVTKVWGYRTILKYANQLNKEKLLPT